MTKQLRSIQVSVKLSIMVKVDDIGAIFVVGNINASYYKKHVDIRYKYVN